MSIIGERCRIVVITQFPELGKISLLILCPIPVNQRTKFNLQGKLL